MKLIILILINCTLFVNRAKAQESQINKTSNNKELYDINIKKYHTNKAVGWGFVGAGAITLVLGVVRPTPPRYYINNDPAQGYPKQKIGKYAIAGTILGAASLPFFVNALKYKRKSIALQSETAILLELAKYIIQYPALSFKMQL